MMLSCFRVVTPITSPDNRTALILRDPRETT